MLTERRGAAAAAVLARAAAAAAGATIKPWVVANAKTKQAKTLLIAAAGAIVMLCGV
jgi:hypothetical protein